MANCCDYSPCEGLATIGFMRSLIPNEMDFCVPVSAGTIVPTCCGNVSESNYVPKYSELTGGTFAIVRRINDVNPSLDRNGFTYVAPTVINGCCTGDTQENEALMKSQLGFEYTSSVTCSHIILKEPTHCDLNYGLIVIKEWDRHRYECDANSSGNIKHTTNRVTYSADTSDSLKREIKEDISGGRHEYKFSFSSVAISSETAAPCSAIKTASTIFSAATYTRGFSLNCPGRVPCGGVKDLTIATIDQLECDGEISLEITCNIEDTPETYTLVGSSSGTTAQTITIGENLGGRTGGTISVKATVWDKVFTDSCPFEREVCGWSPTDKETTDCSIFTHKLEWSERPNIIEHSCQ